jgi:hypothetical protein
MILFLFLGKVYFVDHITRHQNTSSEVKIIIQALDQVTFDVTISFSLTSEVNYFLGTNPMACAN